MAGYYQQSRRMRERWRDSTWRRKMRRALKRSHRTRWTAAARRTAAKKARAARVARPLTGKQRRAIADGQRLRWAGRQEPAIRLSRLDLGWLVGILEGEGCFHIPTGNRYSPRVSVRMCDKDIVERAHRLTGATSSVVRVTRTPRKPAYDLNVTGPRAVALMRIVLPHMGKRRGAKIRGILGGWDRNEERSGRLRSTTP